MVDVLFPELGGVSVRDERKRSKVLCARLLDNDESLSGNSATTYVIGFAICSSLYAKDLTGPPILHNIVDGAFDDSHIPFTHSGFS